MAEYESNMIKPVDGLQNITGLAPARRREERSRRRKLHKENEDNEEQQPNEPDLETPPANSQDSWNENEDSPDDRKIDYRA